MARTRTWDDMSGFSCPNGRGLSSRSSLARTLGVGPQDRCSTAISQELCVAAANAVLPRREVHQASV